MREEEEEMLTDIASQECKKIKRKILTMPSLQGAWGESRGGTKVSTRRYVDFRTSCTPSLLSSSPNPHLGTCFPSLHLRAPLKLPPPTPPRSVPTFLPNWPDHCWAQYLPHLTFIIIQVLQPHDGKEQMKVEGIHILKTTFLLVYLFVFCFNRHTLSFLLSSEA